MTIEKRLYVLGLFDPTTTEPNPLTNPGTTKPNTPSRWTLPSLQSLTVSQFLQLREAGAVKISDLSELAPSGKYAVVYPLDHTRKVLRCRHIRGLLPDTVEVTGEWKIIVRELATIPPLRDYREGE